MSNKINWTNDRVKLRDLKPWEHNPRMSSGKQAERITRSVERFGQVHAVAIGPRGEIYDGHQRLAALKAKHGADYEIDVRRSSRELSDDEQRRLVIALHTGAQGQYDWDLLSSWDPSLLIGEGMDADLLKQLDAERAAVAEMLKAESGGDVVDAEPQIDKSAELAEKWQTKRGQIWQLGDHRLMCGDSTSKDDVARIDSDSCVTLIYDPEWDDAPKMQRRDSVIAFTDCQRAADVFNMFGAPAWVFVWDCVSSWHTPNRPLKRGKLAFWYGRVANYKFDGAHYGDAGESRNVENTRGAYTFNPDPRGKHLSDVFSCAITDLHSGSEHSHSKPIDWVRMLIGNCTDGDVFDPFSGSGTTLIACEQLGRKCRAMEISPGYVAVALQRWADATGKTPALLEPVP